MMRRWFVGAASLIVIGGVGFRGAVEASVRGADPGRVSKEQQQGQEQRPIQGSFASLRMTATGGGTTATGGKSGAGWEERSREDDPANLKVERVKAVEAEPLAVDQGAAGLEQMLRKLRTRASLMMIVAHPDDEDGGMLTYESRGQGARVGMLTLTRGEGGQNVMTGDFNEALGLVRTRELLAADRYLGVDQMFGTEVDFGFSKTKEEAFAQWTHERVLYDAVRAVRLYRPLVVASVFIGAPRDGHGQHQVSGEMAQEVFTAAADPKVFPEMGLPAWAPAKVYGRVPFARVDEHGMFDYATGKYVPARFYNYVTKVWSTETPKADVTVPEGEPSAALGGKSYVQFARQGLALQRTQIGSGVRLAPAGRFDVGYTRYGSRVLRRVRRRVSLMGWIRRWRGLPGWRLRLRGSEGQRLRGGVDAYRRDGEEGGDGVRQGEHGEECAGAAGWVGAVDALIAGVEAAPGVDERERYDVLHELRVKRVQFNDAVVMALGLEMRAGMAATAGGGVVGSEVQLIPGSGYLVQVNLMPKAAKVEVTECHVEEHAGGVPAGSRARPPIVFPRGTGARGACGGTIQANARGVRVPYSKKNPDQPFYDVSDPRMRDAALPLPALTAWIDVTYDGVSLRLGRVVGEEESGAYQPVTVVPAAERFDVAGGGCGSVERDELSADGAGEERRARWSAGAGAAGSAGWVEVGARVRWSSRRQRPGRRRRFPFG